MPNVVAADTASGQRLRTIGNGHRPKASDPCTPAGLLIDPSVHARRTALHLPDRLSLADWKRVGEQISLISSASSWWLGDWLVYGQDKYPDRYRVAISEAALDYQTLRNYAWVARKFPLSRRRDTLSLQHHCEVASLSEVDQDIWLERAVRFKWSKAELRRQLRASAESPGPGESTTALSVSICMEQRQRWQEAADAAECTLAEWVIQVADAAAIAATKAS